LTFEYVLGARTIQEDDLRVYNATRTIVQAGESEFELLEPASAGAVAAHLERWGEGIFAAGFSTDDPSLLARLFEMEVPEIYDGTVQIRGCVREAGERAKVAVVSRERDVDPVGACVGMKGTRVQSIIRELRGEKIDIVEWSEDPTTFVVNALSPAKVSRVSILDEEQRIMEVVVEDKQLSLAIGKKGQNARLAAKLTGFRVDIKSEGEIEEERRRDEEERAEGREDLGRLPGVGPQLIDRLVDAGLHSPARIVAAGLPALQALPGIGETKATSILAAAAAWVAEHPAPVASSGDPETPGADNGGPQIEPSHLEH